MFRGQFKHTIDPKGRLSIPAKFRDALATGLGERLVIVPRSGRALDVYPLQKWEELETKVKALPRLDKDAREFQYRYLSLGQEVTLDPQGRILISPDYRQRVGLAKDVQVIGMIDHFEVWDAPRAAQQEREYPGPLDDLFERLAGKGV